MQIHTRHIFSSSCITYSNSRAHTLHSSHKEMFTYMTQLPNLKPESPTDSLTRVQVSPFWTLSPPALQHLKPRLLLMFLLTCIYSVISSPAPSSHLMLKRSKMFQKGWTNLKLKLSIRKPKFLKAYLKSPVKNIPHYMQQLELERQKCTVTKKCLRRTGRRTWSQERRQPCPPGSRENHQGDALSHG